MGIQKTLIQKTYEMFVDSDSLTVDICSANRQFDWLEILLVSDKNDNHLTICYSYDVKHVVRVWIENYSEAYS